MIHLNKRQRRELTECVIEIWEEGFAAGVEAQDYEKSIPEGDVEEWVNIIIDNLK